MMRLPMVRSCCSESVADDASPRSGSVCAPQGATARHSERARRRGRTVTNEGSAALLLSGIMTEKLTHFDERGAARMVDVGGKEETHRTATAAGFIRMQPQTLEIV